MGRMPIAKDPAGSTNLKPMRQGETRFRKLKDILEIYKPVEEFEKKHSKETDKEYTEWLNR
jgi:hypothetical protein